MEKIDSITLAIYIAEKSFKGKVDKSGSPYFGHLERVANGIGVVCFNSPDIICAAYLHDLLEDCPEWNEDSLSTLFNDEIVSTVVVLTRGKNEDYDAYIKRVSGNKNAVTIKLSDLRDNMDMNRLDEITEKDISRLKKYHKAYKYLTR